MLATAVCFAAGIFFSHIIWRPVATLVVASFAMTVVCLVAIFRAPRLALGCTLLTWCALGWTCGAMRPRAVPSRVLLPFEDGLRRDVKGTLVRVERLAAQTPVPDVDRENSSHNGLDDLEDSAAGEKSFSVDLQLDSAEEVTPDTSRMVAVPGTVRLTLYAPSSFALPTCGAAILVTTRLHAPQEFRDPGVWQRSQYLAESGIVAVGSVSARDWRVIGKGSSTIPCRLAGLRQHAAQRIAAFTRWQSALRLPRVCQWTPADAGLLDAMLLGDRTYLDRNLRLRFERTGTFHLFVVAGMHVVFVAAMVFWLLRKCRAPEWAATVGALLLTTAYAFATGFREPVQRALLMTAVYMAARLLGRARNVLNAVGAAALVMMSARPETLFDAGFQMTVLVALAVGGIAAPLLERTVSPYVRACSRIRLLRLDQHAPPALAQFRVSLRTFGQSLATIAGESALPLPAMAASILLRLLAVAALALTTEIVMAIPMAVYFHRVTPFALPANLLVLPLVPVVMCCAFVTFLAALVSPLLALLPGVVTAVALHAVSFSVTTVGGFATADWRIPAPPTFVTALTLLAAATCGWLLRNSSRRMAWLGLTLLPLVSIALLLPWPAHTRKGVLEVTAIDVGQGESLLIAGPDGGTMLIDAGGQTGPEQQSERRNFDMGEDVVSPYLWSRGIRTLDVLVLTHAHMDHLGGMDAVLRNFRPRELWISVEPTSPALHTLLTNASAQHVSIHHLHARDNMPWNGLTIDVLSPSQDYTAGSTPQNDDSLVLRLQYGAASALLEGDAERHSEETMVHSGEIGPVTLLQVGHHGSDTSSTDAFLKAAQPRAAVISCGRGNRFGHPRFAVLQRLQNATARTYRTDTMGATQFLLTHDGGITARVLTSDAP